MTFAAILGLAGLALDGARLYAEHERIQSAADAAAIGAAHELGRGHSNYAADLLPAATHDAALHGITPGAAEIIVQYPPITGDNAGSARHVEVVVRAELRTTFMAMFGKHSQTVSARAVAGALPAEQPCLMASTSGESSITVEGGQPFELGCETEPAPQDDVIVKTPQMPGCAGRPPGVADRADDGTVLFWPGCYSDPVEITGGRAQLMPGEHIFLEGLRIRGGVVAGRDVVLLFPASDEQRGVEIAASAAVELNAPTRGDFADVLMFAEEGGAAGDAVLERSADSRWSGSLIFPGRTLRWAPNPPGSAGWSRASAGRIVILEAPGGRAIAAPPLETASAYQVVLTE